MPPPKKPTLGQRLGEAVATRAGRAAILWVILIALFFAFWRLFTPPEPVPAGAPAPNLWLGVLANWIPVLLLVVILYFVVWRGGFGGLRPLREGLARMNEGDLDAAAAQFEKVGRRGWPLGPTGFVLLGLARMRQGGPRTALEAFTRAHRRGAAVPGPVRAQAAQWVALCHAVLGDLEAAEPSIAEARRTSRTRVYGLRVDEIAEAIVLLRRGQPGGAERLLAERWSEIERSTDAVLFRGVRLVRALAAEKAGLPRDEALLAGARPFQRGEYLWLAVEWPEMSRFLEANGFAGAA
jgi:hypothetical protein